MRARSLFASALLASFATASCSLVRSPLLEDPCVVCVSPDRCVAGRCVAGDGGLSLDAPVDMQDSGLVDAPADSAAVDAPVDVAVDVGVDAGSCADGVLSGDESDVDCGGACPSCGACQGCRSADDCAGAAACRAGRCEAVLTPVLSSTREVDAFVRADGAVLLAHYAPGTFHSMYDPFVSQVTTAAGGEAAPPGFAPDPCFESGHLSFAEFVPAGRVVEFACGVAEEAAARVSSSELFRDFSPGDHGVPHSAGAPGWGHISAAGSGLGRARFGVCGTTLDPTVGGVGMCTGPRATDASTHVASFTSGPRGSYVGCDGAMCAGTACPHVWVWLLP